MMPRPPQEGLPALSDWLTPDWQPHPRVRACVTTRLGDYSPAPWHGFNLGLNTGDDPARVERARRHVQKLLGTAHPPNWLRQVHGVEIVRAGAGEVAADAVWSNTPGWPCVVLTADCLPALFARTDGTAVAAVHAGWRGLHAGILERTAALLAPDGEPLSVWLGPAISQPCYQVGAEVREAFVRDDPRASSAFRPDSKPDHWRMSLAELACQRLAAAGNIEVSGGELCTASDLERFYSYRYEGETGRFASLVWLAD